MAFKIKDLMINVLPTGPAAVCGPGGTCTAITPECGHPTVVCNPAVNPATGVCGAAVTHCVGCTLVHCTVVHTACGVCTNVLTCHCTALCTANCTASICQACSAVASGCAACSLQCTCTATPCACTVHTCGCTAIHTACGCTIHTGCIAGCTVVSGGCTAAVASIPTPPGVGPTPEATFTALSALKDQLKAQLAEVDKQHQAASDSLLPQTVEEVDSLTQKLQGAIDELKNRRAELAKKAKPADKK